MLPAEHKAELVAIANELLAQKPEA
jgi:hypothetical protein